MVIEPGDTIELFCDQVRGSYLHGTDWCPHTARPGMYLVLDVIGKSVLLGIPRRVTGGMDIFRCSVDSLAAVVLDEHRKPRLKYTIENSGGWDRIYATGANGDFECVAEVVNRKLCDRMLLLEAQ
jgi:hypothetical protein